MKELYESMKDLLQRIDRKAIANQTNKQEVINFVARLIQLQFPNSCVNIIDEEDAMLIQVSDDLYHSLSYHTFCVELQKYILWPYGVLNVHFTGYESCKKTDKSHRMKS